MSSQHSAPSRSAVRSDDLATAFDYLTAGPYQHDFRRKRQHFCSERTPNLEVFHLPPCKHSQTLLGGPEIDTALTAKVMSAGLLSANALPMLKCFNAGL